MNITFLIGNGFDRNLGLDTTYLDFVKWYKEIEAKTVTLKKFHEHIEENEELWSAAEIAMGEYTSQFEKGKAKDFAECHTDFCEQLALYLKAQMHRMDYTASKAAILRAFSKMNQITASFPTQERQILNDLYDRRNDEPISFNFICFNYTNTLDRCLSLVKSSPDTLGSHKNGTRILGHTIGQICHVHGTVEKEMVFGVNDDSQISKIDIFDCEDGDLCKNILIKIKANASFLENTDTKAAEMLQKSNLIYVYGMSIGATDRLWWDRICTWLNGSGDRHLIVQKYGMPAKSVAQLPYQIEVRNVKRNVLKYSSLPQGAKDNIEGRIHITGENIFKDIRSIAKELGHKEYMTVLNQIVENNTTPA